MPWSYPNISVDHSGYWNRIQGRLISRCANFNEEISFFGCDFIILDTLLHLPSNNVILLPCMSFQGLFLIVWLVKLIGNDPKFSEPVRPPPSEADWLQQQHICQIWRLRTTLQWPWSLQWRMSSCQQLHPPLLSHVGWKMIFVERFTLATCCFIHFFHTNASILSYRLLSLKVLK